MLRLTGLRKSFYDPGRGEVKAVDGIDLEIGPGVCALVGANGAGKSTLLRLVASLLVPDAGSVELNGLDAVRDAERLRSRLGYLATSTRLYRRLSGRELLAYAGGFFGLAGPELERRIAAQIAAFGLEPFIDQRTDGLSTGQLQRLNLARTLLPEPELLILDEPTTGLDLVAARQVVEGVQALRRGQRTVLFCTHHLDEVEAVADRLLVLRDGRIVFDGQAAHLGTGPELAERVHGLIAGVAA